MTRFAFFDVDGTLLLINSMLDFIGYFFVRYHGNLKGQEKSMEYARRRLYQYEGFTREQLNEEYYKHFCGVDEEVLTKLGSNWFDEKIASRESIFNKNVLSQLYKHQKEGVSVVFVSGGCMAFLRPLASYLNVPHILCVKPKVAQGKLTGQIQGIQTIGQGKVKAIQQWLAGRKDVDYKNSFAYGDHESDIPMLELVGKPFVVGDNPALQRKVKGHHWAYICL